MGMTSGVSGTELGSLFKVVINRLNRVRIGVQVNAISVLMPVSLKIFNVYTKPFVEKSLGNSTLR